MLRAATAHQEGRRRWLLAETAGLVPGDVVLSINGVSGLTNFQVVKQLGEERGWFNLVVMSPRMA